MMQSPAAPAMNGQASSLFNDRRGQNPFQPVVPASMAPRSTASQLAQHTATAIPNRYDSYIGRGSRMPNGAAPLRAINGRGTLRENPDTLGLQQRRLSIGDGLT